MIKPLMDLQKLLGDKLKDRACLHCGKRLTNQDSIKNRVGPVCRHKVVMKYAKLYASYFWKPEEDYYLEIAEKAFDEYDNLDYVLVGGSYYYETLVATLDKNGDPMVVTWINGYGEKKETNDDALEWINTVKNTFNVETLHECVHEDDHGLSLLDSYWGPCKDLKKHPNRPADDNWGPIYSMSAWENFNIMLEEWCFGFEWCEQIYEITSRRQREGLPHCILDLIEWRLTRREEELAAKEFSHCLDFALEMTSGYGEDFMATRKQLKL